VGKRKKIKKNNCARQIVLKSISAREKKVHPRQVGPELKIMMKTMPDIMAIIFIQTCGDFGCTMFHC